MSLVDLDNATIESSETTIRRGLTMVQKNKQVFFQQFSFSRFISVVQGPLQLVLYFDELPAQSSLREGTPLRSHRIHVVFKTITRGRPDSSNDEDGEGQRSCCCQGPVVVRRGQGLVCSASQPISSQCARHENPQPVSAQTLSQPRSKMLQFLA